MIKARESKGVVELSPEQLELHQNMLQKKMLDTEATQKPKPEFVREGKVVSGEQDRSKTVVTHGM